MQEKPVSNRVDTDRCNEMYIVQNVYRYHTDQIFGCFIVCQTLIMQNICRILMKMAADKTIMTSMQLTRVDVLDHTSFPAQRQMLICSSGFI